MIDRRKSAFRRQVNQAFCAPDGSFSITKTIAVFAQIAILYHMGRSFDHLIEKPESLLIIVVILIAPDLFKKFLHMKLGDAHETRKPEPGSG